MAYSALTDPRLEIFYGQVLDILERQHIPFLVGGGLAVEHYSIPSRSTKDMDVFCKCGDFLRILGALNEAGVATTVVDDRWLGKATGEYGEVDIIFSSHNYINMVDDSWFEYAREGELFGRRVKLVGPEDIIWCKTYIQDRNRFDGADINHLILDQGERLNWRRLLSRMEADWELLLGALLNFRYVYPPMRGQVPAWVMDELTTRLHRQLEAPIPQEQTCRGPLISRHDYTVDVQERGFNVIS